MRLKHLVVGVAVVVSAAAVVTTALAEDGIYIPLMSYRTGPYSGAGAAIFNGMSDYLNMLNARDGGVGGARLIVEECETGYDTKKGVECYDSTKGKNPVVSTPYSTGITLQLIPKAAVDKIPIFRWPMAFPPRPTATIFRGSSIRLLRIGTARPHSCDTPPKSKAASTSSRARQSVSFILTHPTARNRSPLFEALAKDYGFTLKLYPVPGAQMQNQTSLWLDVRRDRPDWIYLQGWGAMNPTALKEASKIGLPMNRLVGVWWAGGEDDVRPAGELAKGYSSLNFSGVGQNFPAIQDILARGFFQPSGRRSSA